MAITIRALALSGAAVLGGISSAWGGYVPGSGACEL